MLYDDLVPSGTYLAHFGIKGMRWGIRRFQNDDGSLTSAGKIRYKYDVDSAKQKYTAAKEQYKARKSDKNRSMMELAKNEYDNERVKEKLNKETKVSNHRQKLIDRYKNEGLTQEEAEIAAYKRDKAEKIAIAAVTATAVTAAAIVAKKHYDKNVDQFISSNTKFHRIQAGEDLNVEGAFYAAYKQTDRMKYRGLYGNQLKNGVFGFGGTNEPIYDVVVEAKSKIKIASPKTARETLENIINSDPSAKKTLMDNLEPNLFMGVKQKQVMRSAKNALQKGKVNDDVYKAYNLLLVDHGDLQSIHDTFFSSLKNRGYGGIVDFNDKFYSGYKAKKPCILFGGSRDFAKTAAKELRSEKINMDLAGGYGLLLGESAAKVGAAVGAYRGVRSLINRYSRTTRLNEAALSYRREHPQTQKSIDEIRRMIEENRYVR